MKLNASRKRRNWKSSVSESSRNVLPIVKERSMLSVLSAHLKKVSVGPAERRRKRQSLLASRPWNLIKLVANNSSSAR